jgi:hypothetical protein
MSPKLVSASLLATLAAAALVAPPALGDYSAPTWNGTGRIWNSYLYSRPAREALRRRQQQGQGPAQGQPAQPARPRPAGTTTFAAGPPAVLAKVPPQERPKIARLLSDCHTVYGRMMAQAGGMTSPPPPPST